MQRPIMMQWYEKVRIMHVAHLIAARSWESRHNYIGFGAIVAGIFAGYELVTKGPETEWLAYVLGSLAIIAAVGNAAMKFFGLENRMQRHRAAALQYASLRYEMERYLMVPGRRIPEDLYERVSTQLAEIGKNAPLLSEATYKTAEDRVHRQTIAEIPDQYVYDTVLTENWRFDNGQIIEIGNNPIRSYVCETATMSEYHQNGETIIHIPLTMTRDGTKFPCNIHAQGTMDNNTAFLRYDFKENSTGITTYGIMVLMFTNRIEVEGYWMAAGVKGAKFLIGAIKMKIRPGHITEPQQGNMEQGKEEQRNVLPAELIPKSDSREKKRGRIINKNICADK